MKRQFSAAQTLSFRNVIIGTALAMVLSACVSAPEKPTYDSSLSSSASYNKAVVGKLFDAFNRHDPEALAALYTAEGVLITPESCAPIKGREAIAANYRTLFDQIPDVTDTIIEMVAEKDKVAVTFTAASQIDGAEFTLPIAAFLSFENGFITRDEAYFDTDVVLNCDD